MTNLIKLILAFFSLSLIVFTACKKDVDQFFPDGSDEWPTQVDGNVQDLLDNLKPQPYQYDIFPNNSEIQIITPRLTRVTIPSGRLKYLDGEIASGQVKMTFLEAYGKKDMILLQRPTVTNNGDILRSAGFFQLTFSQNGEELFLDGFPVIEFLAEEFDEEMGLFVENDFENEPWAWRPWEGGINESFWLDTIIIDTITGGDTINMDSSLVTGYQIISSQFEWLNCDAFVEIPAELKTTVCAKLPSEYSNVNAVVFIVFKNFNGVIELHGIPEFQLFCQYNLPIGEEVTVVTLASTAPNEYQFDFVETTITENMVVDLNPETETPEEILEFLDGL